MAKVKSVEFEIRGTREKFDIKVNSKGIFFIDIPEHLIDVFDGITNRSYMISNTTLDGIERMLGNAIANYKNSKVTCDLFIKIYYGASMEYAENKDGGRLFPHHGSEYNMSGGFMNTSSIAFDFEVLMKVTRDEKVTWYETTKWKGSSDERFSEITQEREMVNEGDIVATRRLHHFESKTGLLPYSEAVLMQLTHIQDELRKISETLYKLVELDPVKLEEAILNTKLIQ